MSSELSKSNTLTPEVQAKLEGLADLANQAHGRFLGAARTAVEHALEAGRALHEAKRVCPIGLWHSWVAEHFKASLRTAQVYMRLAARFPHQGYHAQHAAPLTTRELGKLIAGLPPTDGRAPSGQSVRNDRRSAGQVSAERAAAGGRERKSPDEVVEFCDIFGRVWALLGELSEELRRLIPGEGDDTNGMDPSYAEYLFDEVQQIKSELHEWRTAGKETRSAPAA